MQAGVTNSDPIRPLSRNLPGVLAVLVLCALAGLYHPWRSPSAFAFLWGGTLALVVIAAAAIMALRRKRVLRQEQGMAQAARTRSAAADPRKSPREGDPDWDDILRSALLHDLAIVPRLAQQLPLGGLPRSGRLAEHCYVVCETLQHHLDYHRRLDEKRTIKDPIGDLEPGERQADRAEVAAALDQVLRRLDRLFSAERPGGLDHIDLHLARLHKVTKTYLMATRVNRLADTSRAGQTNPARGRTSRTEWWDGIGYRQRARILSWAVIASAGRASPSVAEQPVAVRVLLRLGWQRRAESRANQLGLIDRSDSTVE